MGTPVHDTEEKWPYVVWLGNGFLHYNFIFKIFFTSLRASVITAPTENVVFLQQKDVQQTIYYILLKKKMQIEFRVGFIG